MKKLLLLFALTVGIALAQPPITFTGYVGAAQSAGRVSHVNPGFSVALPFTTLANLPFEYNYVNGTHTALFGFTQTVYGWNNWKNSFNVGASLGSSVDSIGPHFASAYTVGYSRRINWHWAVGPSIRYTLVGHQHGWSESFGIAYSKH
jgi:hypothetical protein